MCLIKILLQKLDGYGINRVLLKWLENFLTIRQQRVVINGNNTQNKTHILETVDSESDLGIMFIKNLKFDEHIDNTINRVNRLNGLIK